MATEQQIRDVAADGTGAGADSLTVTDNRTGRTYELPIADGTVKGMDLRQIKVSEDDFGLMSYDPAFTNTASCRSAITYIDGEAGILQHRGYSIEQLCERSTFLEVAYLLIFGELPTGPQLERWTHDITHHTFVHEDIKQFFGGFRYDAHPMGMLLAGVGALSTFYPDAKQIDDPEERYMAAVRLIAKVPTLAAFAYRHNMGLPYVYPDNDLSFAEQLPLDDVQEDRGEVRAGPAAVAGAGRALHPPRRPRAELLDQRGARRRLLRRRPLLRGRGRRGGALRAAARRRQRGGAADAAENRVGGEHPRLPREGEDARRETDGLRPPRLQELRPAGADHRAAHGGGLRGDRVQRSWSRSPASWRSGRSTTSTSPRASSTRTSTTTRGSSTRRWRSRPRCSR